MDSFEVFVVSWASYGSLALCYFRFTTQGQLHHRNPNRSTLFMRANRVTPKKWLSGVTQMGRAIFRSKLGRKCGQADTTQTASTLPCPANKWHKN
jgi:hypothetical protein